MPSSIDIHENEFLEETYQEGIERGIEEGMAKGIEQGVEQGREETLRRMLAQISLDQGLLSAAQAEQRLGQASADEMEGWLRRLAAGDATFWKNE